MPKILVVDDEKRIIELARIILESNGYQVSTAENGADALESFERDRPDLVLLDVNMPGMNGIDVCRELKRQAFSKNHVPVVMFTVDPDPARRRMAQEAGCDGYILKVISSDGLLQEVQRYLKLLNSP